ncbi:hypothetical protein L195_g034286 [Trifolium pratense]|uniref:Uncharacterized protein n=1 Tax=Trifolium pratense TaxID=57577 RepID=A0A2K3KP66_TRIPR|nr:hypothetical protein L195_g055983 [Trifolium pratense]PNX78309.1 hypothetical protein L195_g034286 [Trifolium pratense]
MTHLPQTTVNQVLAIPTPKISDGPDSIGWSGTNTRHFTVQSAYNLQREYNLSIDGIWKSFWNWKGNIESKLSCGLLPMSVSLRITAEVNGALVYLPLALFAEMKMKQSFMF